MSRARVLPLAALLLASGCLGAGAPDADDPASDRAAALRCVHPWPCGDEWPEGLVGPFAVGEASRLRAPTSAGMLDGALFLPDLPADVRAPVVLEATPYPGCPACMPSHASPLRGTPVEQDTLLEDRGFSFLVEAGYAVAIVNLPGTGNSEGCFDNYGPSTQKALADLVGWLADQPWSNGRVGMYGLSAGGTSPFAAAITNPPALKTIVPAGIESNLYLFEATPQGAMPAENAEPASYSSLLAGPPLRGDPASLPGALAGAAERYCPDLLAYATAPQAGAAGDRNAAFWEPRMLNLRFPNATASVFVDHGLMDAFGSGHRYQEDDVWDALRQAPKRMLLGNWAHEYPPDDKLASYEGGSTWSAVVLPWLDFWLKGVGEAPPREGVVDYQDATDAWRSSTSWPPAEAREEALALEAGAFLTRGGLGAACRALSGEESLDALATLTPPLEADVVIAGNAWAYLQLTSDAPAGTLEVKLYDVAPDFACAPDGDVAGAALVSEGAADLRHHAGNMAARDFPVGTPTTVRIDLWNFARHVPAGHRIGIVLQGPGEDYAQDARPARIAVGGGSALVLPLVEGTLGGAPPPAQAPPKPFVPP